MVSWFVVWMMNGFWYGDGGKEKESPDTMDVFLSTYKLTRFLFLTFFYPQCFLIILCSKRA